MATPGRLRGRSLQHCVPLAGLLFPPLPPSFLSALAGPSVCLGQEFSPKSGRRLYLGQSSPPRAAEGLGGGDLGTDIRHPGYQRLPGLPAGRPWAVPSSSVSWSPQLSSGENNTEVTRQVPRGSGSTDLPSVRGQPRAAAAQREL